MAVTLGKAVRYATLPGIVPRTRSLVTSFTTGIAVLIAGAFAAVRLLPTGHPYLIRANTGRFGIRDVLAAGRANLVFRRENSDQIILYYTITIGLVLLMLQSIAFFLAINIHGAHASATGTYWSQFFTTPYPSNDIAFLLLDHVFGIQGLFGSCADPAITCNTVSQTGGAPLPVFTSEHLSVWPTPFQQALWAMFNFYNLGIAAVGLIIFLYIVASVVAETSATGRPFGDRFNRAWALPRMMLAIALLTPITANNSPGLDGAQWITLYVAKWGSSLATNGWILFNTTLAGTTPLGNPENLVPNPTAPGYNILPEFMLIARTCLEAEAALSLENGGAGRTIAAYQVDGNNNWTMPSDFDTALSNAKTGDIKLVFGEQNDDYIADPGHVHPICGSISLQVKDQSSPGAMKIQEEYYTLINTMWTDSDTDMYAKNIVKVATPVGKDPTAALPDADYIDSEKTAFQTASAQAFTDGRSAEVDDPRWTQMYTDLGWAGASIWYNRIAEYNGSFISALRDAPKPDRYPEAMTYNKTNQGTTQNTSDPAAQYCVPTESGYPVHQRGSREFYVSQAECMAQSFWAPAFQSEQSTTGSPVTDLMRKIFGVEGLFNMASNTDVNPLAQLVGIGRSMIDAAKYALGGDILSIAMTLGGDQLHSPLTKTLGGILGSLSTTIIAISLSVGVLLYYILPFVPFIYVFFALGNWVKAIFQAMVGLPLWALSHIRIDGDGLPGPALDGYFLIFEIFLRPITIIFGLIGSITIFTAQVQVLNQIWTLVVANITGHNESVVADASVVDQIRDYMDSFAFTVLYAMVVYMMALSSFKLIDLIPASIMRWIGQADLQGFGVGEEDAGGEFMAGAKAGVNNVQGVFGKGIYGLLFGKGGGATK